MPESVEPARLVNARTYLMGVTAGRASDVVALLDPAVLYTVPGRGPQAGVFRGPVEVCAHIDKLFGATSGTVETLKWMDWMVGLRHVAALQSVQAQGGGMIYRNHHLYVMETGENDLLTQIRVYFEDQDQADMFFTNLRTE